jgi:hypothetical protein
VKTLNRLWGCLNALCDALDVLTGTVLNEVTRFNEAGDRHTTRGLEAFADATAPAAPQENGAAKPVRAAGKRA